MARDIDARRVLAARLTGIAAGCAHTRRVTVDEALAEIATTLTGAGIKVGTEAARSVLTLAASMYAVERPRSDEWWFAGALDVLVRAGADESQARARRAVGL